MSGVFGGGHKPTQSTTPTRFNAMQIMQSSYGNCIPLLYGTDRLPMTLIDYVDFTSTPVSDPSSQGGKGGHGGNSTAPSYTYSTTFIAALSEGPITDIINVFQNQSVTTIDALGLVFFYGIDFQAPWTYMQQHHPDHALPYELTSYVVAPKFQLGSNAGLPNLTFEIKGLLVTAPNRLDCSPRDYIPDYLNNPGHGAGFPYLGDLSDYGNYCTAMGFYFSPSESTQRGAVEFINETLQMTNSNAVWSPGVGLRIVPYCDAPVTGNGTTYTPNLTPIYELFDDSYTVIDEQGNTAPVVVDITPANETFNCWNVEFLDRSNQYNTNISQYQDELDVSANGLRTNTTISFHAIKNAGIAKLVATLLCNRNLYVRTQFTMKLPGSYCLLEPMDLISINDSRVGIVDQLVRIISVTDEADDSLTIVAEEMVVGPASAPLYNTQLAQAFAQNFLGDPGPVAVPYMFTFPPKLADPASNGYELGIAVGGTGGAWGGAEVWMSLDNLTYWRVGVVDAPSRYGTISQALPVGNDSDTTNVLTVQLNPATPLTMLGGTRADADRLLTPCIVDGEIISYQNSTPQGANAFSLSYLRRGQYGSTSALHAVGTKFAVIDQDIFRMKFDPGYAGLPFWVKFRSFNLFGGGTESLADVTAYQGFFQGQNSGVLEAPGAVELVARGACVVSGAQVYKRPNAADGWDSDAYSRVAFSGGCVARATARTFNTYIMFGLNTDPLTDSNYTSLDYAWYLAAGALLIYRDGVLVNTVGRGYVNGTVLEVRYDGQYVTWLADNVVYLRVAAPGKSLYWDCSFYSASGLIDNVYFGLLNPATPTPFFQIGDTNQVGAERVYKPASGISAWNGAVYSYEGFPVCHAQFKADTSTGYMAVGLTNAPGTSIDNGSVLWGFYLNATGRWNEIYNGSIVPTIGGLYDTTTVFSVVYDGTAVFKYVNGVVVDTSTLVGANLYFAASAYTAGMGINSLLWGPGTAPVLSDTNQIAPNAATGVYTDYVLGPTNVASGTPQSVRLNSVYFTNNQFPTDVDVTITAQGNYSNTSASVASIVSAQIFQFLFGVSWTPDSTHYLTVTPVSGSESGSYSLEANFTILKSSLTDPHGWGFELWVEHNTSGGTCTFSNALFKVEVIKR